MNYTENLSLGLPEYGESADVAALNRNSGILDAYVYNTRQMECEPYDSTKTYMSGDLAIHNEVIYECNTDNTTGTWDDSKWDSTTLAEQIAKAKQSGGESALADLEDVEITNPSTGQALLFDDDDDVWKNQNLPDVSVTKTVSGNPVEFTDGADAPMVKCVTQITGSQDLHGYDKPWVGGAGKNKLPLVLSDLHTINNIGTWISDTIYQRSGVTYEILTDSDGNINGIKTSGGASGANSAFTFPPIGFNGDVILNGCPLNGSTSTYAIFTSQDVNIRDTGNGASYNSTTDSYVYIFFREGYTIPSGGLMFYPMIRLATETDPTFAPYSNICPITAYTEGEIEVSSESLISPSSFEVGAINTETGEDLNGSSYASVRRTIMIDVESSKNYLLSGFVGGTAIRVFWYSDSGSYIGNTLINITDMTTIISTGNAKKIRFQGDASIFPTNYDGMRLVREHTTHTTTYPSAIYRGSEDVVNGEVTSEWVKETFDGTLHGTYTLISSGRLNIDININYQHDTGLTGKSISNQYEELAQTNNNSDFDALASDKDGVYNLNANTSFRAIRIKDSRFTDLATAISILAQTPLEVAFQLATPTASSVTPTNLPIRTLSGYNHIESTTGDMEIEYITQNYQPLVDLIQSGNGHTYSTQEQVVGTWVDGKTLYEKTLTVTSPTATTVGSYDVYKLGELTGVDVAMFKTGVFIDATDHRNYGLSYDRYYSNTDKMIPEVYVDSQTNTMYAYATCTHSAGFTVSELTMTVQYTKSTTTRSLNAPLTSQKAQIEPLTTKEDEVPTEEEKAVNEEENNDER